MAKSELTRRLSAAFSLVREGRAVADIGTDHAYLPIKLVSSGVSPEAYASDIGKGPLERAKLNIERSGLSDRIDTVLTDGAAYFDGLCDEYIVAGMGGELIADIISRAPHLKSTDIHMVLQPMTRAHVLREYLSKEGFYVQREKLVSDGGKIYVVMSVYYDGVSRNIDTVSSLLGRTEDYLADGDGELLKKLISSISHDIDNRIYGRLEAGESVEEEREIRRRLQEIRSNI